MGETIKKVVHVRPKQPMPRDWCDQCGFSRGTHSTLCINNEKFDAVEARNLVAEAWDNRRAAIARASIFEGKASILRHANNRLRKRMERLRDEKIFLEDENDHLMTEIEGLEAARDDR